MSVTIKMDRKILEKNDVIAERNRARFRRSSLPAVNIMSSPGAGKTSLLEATVKMLAGKVSVGVIEGDIATDSDARRVEKAGAAWVAQINTGGTCHLNAGMVEKALENMPPRLGLLIIENVGNLVCPAGFDLGEDERVMLASVTEGLDKPKKYPGMYRACGTLVINKTDLAPHLEVSPRDFAREALEVNPALRVFQTSATRGDGVEEWCAWLLSVVEKTGGPGAV